MHFGRNQLLPDSIGFWCSKLALKLLNSIPNSKFKIANKLLELFSNFTPNPRSPEKVVLFPIRRSGKLRSVKTSLNTLLRVTGSGPPLRFRETSPCPGLDHLVSGLYPVTVRAFTRCASLPTRKLL